MPGGGCVYVCMLGGGGECQVWVSELQDGGNVREMGICDHGAFILCNPQNIHAIWTTILMSM